MKEKKSKGRLVGNILLVISVIGLVVAVVGLVATTQKYRVASREYSGLQEEYVQPAEDGGNRIDFAALREINPEFVGWLEIPGTNVNYPVARNDDNNYYIDRTFEGTYNPAGSVFLDARNDPGMTDTNSVFYGHNMKDKSMFATVQNYCVDPEFRELHDTIYFYTEDAVLVYEVFAMRQTTIEDGAYQLDFSSESAQNAFFAGDGQGRRHPAGWGPDHHAFHLRERRGRPDATPVYCAGRIAGGKAPGAANSPAGFGLLACRYFIDIALCQTLAVRRGFFVQKGSRCQW